MLYLGSLNSQGTNNNGIDKHEETYCFKFKTYGHRH